MRDYGTHFQALPSLTFPSQFSSLDTCFCRVLNDVAVINTRPFDVTSATLFKAWSLSSDVQKRIHEIFTLCADMKCPQQLQETFLKRHVLSKLSMRTDYLDLLGHQATPLFLGLICTFCINAQNDKPWPHVRNWLHHWRWEISQVPKKI